MKEFEEDYAKLYDLVYEEKDYETECEMLVRAFREFGSKPVKSILDFGCGTGGHVLPLARRGFEVSGVDRSEHMLSIAKEKSDAERLRSEFYHQDICTANLGRRFDAAICMFAVLCYQLSNEALEQALHTAARHLHRDGLYIFDFWFGPAVLTLRPEKRVKVFEKGSSKIHRTATPCLKPLLHQCSTEFKLVQTEGEKVISQTEETHTVRYFFPLEIEYFLSKAGFQLLRLGGTPDYQEEIDERSWNVTAVAKLTGV